MDAEAPVNAPILIIRNVSKEKQMDQLEMFLDSSLGKHAVDYLMIPLEDSLNIEVQCSEKEELQLIANLIEQMCPSVQLDYDVQSQQQAQQSPNQLVEAEKKKLFMLPTEILSKIFRKLSLKDQIAVAKVCRQFHLIIRDEWRLKYKRMCYSLRRFEIIEQLSDKELEDFFIVIGKEVECLDFMAYIEDGILADMRTKEMNQMQANREYLNAHLCRNLKYMRNLKKFCVEGPLLLEETCSVLAKYCKKLAVFKFIDTGSRLISGNYFCLMSNLQTLSLRGSQQIEFNHLFTLCNMVQLKSLNLTKCEPNLNARLIDKLCKNLADLVTFKLSALHGEDMLTSIMQLPKLQRLQFNSYKVTFLSLFLRKLDAYKTLSLKSIRFSYTRWLISRNIASQRRRLIKIHVAHKIGTRIRIDEETFEELMEFLPHFYNLKEIYFEYNLVFSVEQMERMILAMPGLERIYFKDCQLAGEPGIIEMLEKPEIFHKCNFHIDEVETDLMIKYASWIKAQAVGLPPLNSVECYF